MNACTLCGSTGGSMNAQGAHNICAVRARHGDPTPALGDIVDDTMTPELGRFFRTSQTNLTKGSK